MDNVHYDSDSSAPVIEDPVSNGDLAVLTGEGVTLWCDPTTLASLETDTETAFTLWPNRPVIVGRQNGGQIEYLDPAYKPTQVVPDTGQSVLTQGGKKMDNSVSRGHFMLSASTEGILLVNGVPRRGGGIRPPVNGTSLVNPLNRRLQPAEEYLIPQGTKVDILLPNGAIIRIGAR